MGGNAVSNVRRFERDEYYRHLSALAHDIFEILGNVTFAEIPSYHNKPSFGDCDLIVRSDTLPHNWKNDLIDGLNLTEEMYVSNGNVFSFNYHELQVDFIVTDPKYYQSSIDYFSYNDLGNLVGRMAHKLGIKVGHRGLELVVREPVDYGGHILAEIELSKNYDDALRILGLDVAQFHKGFDEIEDIFKYVASSKYFDPEIYLLDNRAHYSRVRDRKRKTYHAFLEWCKETKPKANYNFPDKTEHGGYSIREPYYTDIILKRWPDVRQKVDSVIEQYQFDRNFKTVYNGVIVGEMTGLKDKELGMFMSYMKPLLTDYVKQQMIQYHNTAICFINNHFKEWKNG